MFHKITKIDESIPLVVPIDNTNGDWHVGVTSIDYWNGLQNLKEKGEFNAFNTSGKFIAGNTIFPGFYTFDDVQQLLKFKTKKMVIGGDCLIKMHVKKNTILQLNKALAEFMGFTGITAQRGLRNEVTADRPMEIIPWKLLNFHLEGIHGNSLNGQPSNIVKSIACPQVDSGDLYHEKYERPQFMQLRREKFTELFLELKDECSDLISNQGLPIHVELEFKKITP